MSNGPGLRHFVILSSSGWTPTPHSATMNPYPAMHSRDSMHRLALHLVLALALPATPAFAQQQKPQFVGSEACKSCHTAAYNGWKQTRMANVVQDPKTHPQAVLADFTKPDPLLTFSLDEIAFVYGSRWKQRFFKKIGDDYYPEPAQWDVAKKRWLPYHVEPNTDWWQPFYGKTNFERPTGPTCDGCHSVNYNLESHQVTEWNVGCEKCHGPNACTSCHKDKSIDWAETELRHWTTTSPWRVAQ